MTKIIAVSNHKGGVGKTTSTVNLGAALALKGYKVCLIDLDPQANLTQSFLGCAGNVFGNDHSIYWGMKNPGKHLVCSLPSPSDPPGEGRLLFVASSLDLSATEIEISSQVGREYFLKEVISSMRKNNPRFDYILIDCPPSLGLLTINALTAADEVLIPLHAEYLPFNGLNNLVEVINKIKFRLNPALKISGVFFTKYDSRKILNRDTAENVQELFGDKLLTTKISNNIALAEAPSRYQDIFSYDNKCKGALDYMALCEEILEREKNDK